MTLLSHSLSPTTFFEIIKLSNEKSFNKFVLKVQNANFLLVECQKFEFLLVMHHSKSFIEKINK